MSNLRRILMLVSGVVVLMLDYAALDDITTGHQPHFIWEWLFLIVSLPLLGFVGWIFAQRKDLRS